jgi:GNAT superfamily N-acetyltransferase
MALNFEISIVSEKHIKYAKEIAVEIEIAASVQGTGIAIRSSEYIENKIREGQGIIALLDNKLAGFCYIEAWEGNKYVANSGLLVVELYRGKGLGRKIKNEAFALTRKLFPDSIFLGLTTSLAVMKINSELGYVPVTFSELTDDSEFWKGCETCSYYDILFRTRRSNCLCTAMKYNPK